jgi:localization factor PodJL
MRAELPWNVAGIPPEAREAVRAAARREGLSVGEWLTRRIIRSYSGMEEELAPMAYENRAPTPATPDSWGVPAPVAGRRDTEELMARLGRNENESNEAWRRIEDQLKGLSRQLDSGERGHAEPQYGISRQEMDLAAQEQAQAFDKLGTTVMSLTQRLERLEQSTAHDGIREAVKALHQGLSRLADQMTASTGNSADQVVQLTSNLEQLAARVGQARLDMEGADKALEARINDSAAAMGNRLDAIDRSMDARISALEPRISAVDARVSTVEKMAQFNTNALDHALEKIETSANQRATDQVEIQQRAGRHEETLHKLEDSIARLEMRLPDAQFERRLDGIERSVGGMAGQLREYGPADRLEASLRAISDRLDAMERDHGELLTELRTRAPQAIEPPPHEEPQVEPAPQAFEPAHHEQDQAEPAPQAFEPAQDEQDRPEPVPQAFEPAHHEQDRPEPVPQAFEPAHHEQGEPEPAPQAFEPAHDEQDQPEPAPQAFEPPPYESYEQDQAAPAQLAFEPPPHAELPPAHEDMVEPASLSGFASEAAHPFADAGIPHDFAFDIPPQPSDEIAPPEFDDMFVDKPEPENFLAQARRSARAASEKAESEGRSRLSAFRWNKDLAVGDENSRPRYLLPALVVALVVVTAVAALVLYHRAQNSDVATTHATRPATATGSGNSHSNPSRGGAPFVPVPQAGQNGNEQNFATQRSEPDSQDGPSQAATPSSQNEALNAPVNPAPQTANPNTAQPNNATIDKVIQLANAGNPIALTILGLRDLDGTGGAPVNMPAAVKFLSQAAEKGQAVAQYRLGTVYERGQGVAADPAKAAHWYELSANQGNRKAMHNLAVSYAGGALGKKDMTEAARWFAKAAVLGLSDSQFNLAVLYERGDGVPQSLLDAYKWYSIAGATGDSESKQRMSFLQTQLSDTDRAAANKSAASFHATPLNRSANVPPEPSDLGG